MPKVVCFKADIEMQVNYYNQMELSTVLCCIKGASW